ncbi:MAG TPA: CotH kinase family protein [Polyangium sp.]|nr:CotH kinase family protein [Polyangium sp.]
MLLVPQSSRNFEQTMTTLGRLVWLLGMIALVAGCSEEVVAPVPEVFDSAVLHKIEVTVESTYLNQLATDLDNRVPCTFVYDGEPVEQAGIRQKGNTAFALDEKPSFSVRFDEFDSKGDLHGLHKILLNNSVQDPTFMREKLGADAHARAGIAAARIAYAQMTFNGVDGGIYVVAEAIDKDFLQLHFGKDYDEGNLFEGPCCGDFAVDANYREVEMTLDDEKKDDRTRDDINTLAQVIRDAPDATFPTDLARVLDVDEFLEIYALEVILLHWDGFSFGKNNYYMYDNPANSRFVFFPHGMDRILTDLNFDFSAASLATLLPQRIRANPTLDSKFQTHLDDLGKSSWNKSTMLATIDSTSALLHQASAGTQTKADLALIDANLAQLRQVITIVDVEMNP